MTAKMTGQYPDKRSEKIRVLPDGWRWVRLREVCDDIYRYPSFYGMEHLTKGIPVIRGEHIDNNGEISTDWNDYWFVSSEISNKFPRTILKVGDLVFTVRGTIGKIGFVRNSHKGAQISPNLIRIAPSELVYSPYLFHYFRMIKGSDEAVKDNAVTVATVKASDLNVLRIPPPPLPEQKRIARILNEQMEAIEKARKATNIQLDAINSLPEALLKMAFFGNI